MPEDDPGLVWRGEIFTFLLLNPTKSPQLMAEAKNKALESLKEQAKRLVDAGWSVNFGPVTN